MNSLPGGSCFCKGFGVFIKLRGAT